MGEIDTKPIESVQAALSLFGEKNDQRKYRPTGSDQELEKEKELEGLQKDLANYKVQVEVKDSAYMQAVLKLEYYQKIANELYTLLKNSEVERDKYIDECSEARTRIDELESKMKEMADQLLETIKTREQLSHVLSELNQLKADLELEERKNSDQAVYIESLEMELDHLKLELKNANEEVDRLNCGNEKLMSELQKVKNEMNELREKETEAQVEIALLKSELHKGRSKIAAAEAAEARAISVKSGLYLAVQQLAVEAESAKKENRRLRNNSSQDVELSQIEESKTEGGEERRDDIDAHITISMKEYESLIKKAEKADQVPISPPEDSSHLTTSENRYELEILKKELEVAMVKIGEFRTRAEQALSRAESAEKAKAALEDQLRRWREKKQRRKAALDALREETVPRESNPPKYDKTPTAYQPLGKVLNMKF